MIYRGRVVAVNGTTPGPASAVSYDIEVLLPAGAQVFANVAPERLVFVADGRVNVTGYAQDQELVVAMIGPPTDAELYILTPEPFATQPCGDSA